MVSRAHCLPHTAGEPRTAETASHGVSEDGTFTVCHDQASVHTSGCLWCAQLATDTGALGSEFPFAREEMASGVKTVQRESSTRKAALSPHIRNDLFHSSGITLEHHLKNNIPGCPPAATNRTHQKRRQAAHELSSRINAAKVAVFAKSVSRYNVIPTKA